jgi:membrane-associated phospholipid phosphatase
VHYPFDMLGGAIVGLIAGLVIFLLYRYGLSRIGFLADNPRLKSA